MKKTSITIAIVIFLVFVLPHLITYEQMVILCLASIMGLLVYFMVCDYFKNKNKQITESVYATLKERESEEQAPLELTDIFLNEDYCKQWNVHQRDFIQLTRNGVPVNNSLYRTGMFGGKFKDGYSLFLKHTEALYDDSITSDKARKKHLKSEWCIVDKNGVEKKVFNQFETVYLSGGVIYTVNNGYYNIETDEFICVNSHSITSDEYIFSEDHYNKNESKRGVVQIKKSDGTYKIHPYTR